MLIILEGVDCAGKTSLAKALARSIHVKDKKSEIEIRHSGPPTQHPLGEYENQLFDYRPHSGRHIIYDRLHWGELVYPSVLNRETKFDQAARLHVDMFLRSRGAFIVRVNAPRQLVLDCFRSRGDALIDPSMLDHIEYAYDEAQRTSIVPFTEVSGRVDVDKSIQHIIEHAKREANFAKKLNPFRTYVGPHNPGLLLLGDVRHMVMHGEMTPAFQPFGGTSGHFLLSAMIKQMTLPELARVGIMNACDVDDPNEFAKLTDPEVTIALGVNAHKAAPWATRRVHHPQYVRRFHHATMDEYGHNISGHGSSLPRF